MSLKISIVTPCYNSIAYIRGCVESVRYALEGMDYEHIIVDGKSTDGTVEYLQEQKDIRFVSEKDKNMYDALNKGIGLATGDVIGHLNTDEQYNRKGLRLALQRLEQSGADAVFGPTVMLDKDLKFLQLFKQIVVPRVVDTHWCMPVQSASLLYRKKIWEREPYNDDYRLVADHLWFRRQMEAGMQIVGVREPVGLFVWHAENLSSTIGKDDPQRVLGDQNLKSVRLKSAKLFYRLKKVLQGGYCRSPVSYEIFKEGQLKQESITRPALKVPLSQLR